MRTDNDSAIDKGVQIGAVFTTPAQTRYNTMRLWLDLAGAGDCQKCKKISVL